MFKVSLSSMVSSRPAWDRRDPVSKPKPKLKLKQNKTQKSNHRRKKKNLHII